MINKEAIIKYVDKIIDLYYEAEEMVINERSVSINQDINELENEIAKLKKEIRELLNS